MRWDVAHRVASIAAVHAHRDYGIDRSGYVDVFTAIEAAGIDCMAQALPRLLGMYVAPRDDGPAILVNSGQDEIGIRHSAAHELGHHALGHTSRWDEDPFARWGDGTWPDEEKTAEAFAAWFLMPPPAVRTAMRLADVQAPRSGDDVYQIARWLGTSYAGTVRHLVNVRLARAQQANAWSRIPPTSLRRTAQGPADGPPRTRVGSAALRQRRHRPCGCRRPPTPSAACGGPNRHSRRRYLRARPGGSPAAGRPGPGCRATVAGDVRLTTPEVLLTCCLGDASRPWQVTLAPMPLRRG